MGVVGAREIRGEGHGEVRSYAPLHGRHEGAVRRQVKVVHPNDGKGLPAGQVHHAAGPTADGFLVVAIWDSPASWERFRDDQLLPALRSLPNDLPGPPTETTFEVHNEVTGSAPPGASGRSGPVRRAPARSPSRRRCAGVDQRRTRNAASSSVRRNAQSSAVMA